MKKKLAVCQSREQRRIVDDATVEKLGVLLKANPYGLINLRDRLAGVFKSMEKAGRQSDRAFWLVDWGVKKTGAFKAKQAKVAAEKTEKEKL